MVKTLPSNAGGAGSIPGQEAKIPHAVQAKKQNIKQKQHCNRFDKHFNNGLHKKKKPPLKKTNKQKQTNGITEDVPCTAGNPAGGVDPSSWE